MKYCLLLALAIPLLVAAQSPIEKGKSLYEIKKYEEAEKIFKTVPEKNSDYAVARFYLGRTAFDKKEYEEAADYFEEATEANSKVADYFSWLRYVRYHRSKF